MIQPYGESLFAYNVWGICVFQNLIILLLSCLSPSSSAHVYTAIHNNSVEVVSQASVWSVYTCIVSLCRGLFPLVYTAIFSCTSSGKASLGKSTRSSVKPRTAV